MYLPLSPSPLDQLKLAFWAKKAVLTQAGEPQFSSFSPSCWCRCVSAMNSLALLPTPPTWKEGKCFCFGHNGFFWVIRRWQGRKEKWFYVLTKILALWYILEALKTKENFIQTFLQRTKPSEIKGDYSKSLFPCFFFPWSLMMWYGPEPSLSCWMKRLRLSHDQAFNETQQRAAARHSYGVMKGWWKHILGNHSMSGMWGRKELTEAGDKDSKNLGSKQWLLDNSHWDYQ